MLHGFSLTEGELLCLDKLMLCPLIRVTGAHATANQTLHTNYCSFKPTWSSPHTITHWCPKDPKTPEEPVHTLSSAKETGYDRAALELGSNRKQTQTQNTFLFPCIAQRIYTLPPWCIKLSCKGDLDLAEHRSSALVSSLYMIISKQFH